VLRLEVSTMVKAPRQTVLDVYADYSSWPRLFPTISGVRLLRREGAKLVQELDHVEGTVINKLLVRRPDQLDLWEEKRRYDAWFHNRFETVPGGTRFTVRGDIHLKGWLRPLPAVPRRLHPPTDQAAAAGASAGRARGTCPARRRGDWA
jgi:hypothetical protein